MKTAVCPECEGGNVPVDGVLAGELVVCPDCGVDLEVTAVTPNVVLELAPQEAEDWGE
ncbi:MAG TPA: lysine biosynthesis protein LysW [Candidatus Saccharimonadales bacterium]|nr:lysine biosynthesis protein LysW [Candidatus Saccharimonadales bacterium]